MKLRNPEPLRNRASWSGGAVKCVAARAAGTPPEQCAAMRRHPCALFSGFTLIEMLVVIAIIAILAALILNTAGFIQKKGAYARAESEIAALSAALESYKADTGDYPSSAVFSNSGTGSSSLYSVLAPPTGKVYFEFKKGMTSSAGIIDPFGLPYGYQYPGADTNNGSNFFDLWSTAGSNNNKNTLIKNW